MASVPNLASFRGELLSHAHSSEAPRLVMAIWDLPALPRKKVGKEGPRREYISQREAEYRSRAPEP